jgi:hypothetical protein
MPPDQHASHLTTLGLQIERVLYGVQHSYQQRSKWSKKVEVGKSHVNNESFVAKTRYWRRATCVITSQHDYR